MTGYFLASDAGATYRPLGPVRSLDTRAANGLPGMFATDVPRTWQVAGRDGIPADAIAVSGNVTVTGQTSAGWVAVTPDPVVSPATSTLNFPAADTRANGLTVALGSGGTLSAVYHGNSGGSTHLVFDVTGYYLADLAGARFVPLVPGRVLDSRVVTGLAGPFVTGTPRVLTLVPGSAVPSTATAITGNLTVVNARSAGWVALTDAADRQPEHVHPELPGSRYESQRDHRAPVSDGDGRPDPWGDERHYRPHPRRHRLLPLGKQHHRRPPAGRGGPRRRPFVWRFRIPIPGC